ncbi:MULTISPECIES: F0F1 ATP synthase subunit epsilon [Thioclava]|uniref:ATP synthase epsilon chain n=1 Tax=Thioclava nitratireducens TaxID=1915078 RepID=A0ABM6IFD2_9RHOB|nr:MULTISPECIES: F0F1 ATP synthase subunit epsilon [Thioclava]AQS47385.1 F0F1 ATP synthase subunit epsilon [Thioclava nitratireducens]OWY04380.1 F0F1 ATP synthase subunit epsilon [Thioclava sp. IC9]OWY11187.1 F0F1 ATP synthase subunit epsilon [Thioclava sp. F42-5]OWY13741.1 F0F1 ATP synthase subunit epsilon [Thioclava sp. F34-6]PWE51019.1 F0F1 ATP synthase subunit epsilon [Thioclava sp. NG1]
MRLTIATPLEIVVDAKDVTAIRAEDASGGFGILPGHAEFLTSLSISVISWEAEGKRHYCAVKGGVLMVENGSDVSVSTRAAVTGDLPELGDTILKRFQAEDDAAKTEQADATRLHLLAIRQLVASLDGARTREHWT